MGSSSSRLDGIGPPSLEEALRAPGEHEVDAPIYCSLTRFGLKSARHLLPTYLAYSRVVRQTRVAPVSGLLRAAFLVENPTTCYSLSLWSEHPYMSAQVPEHVQAASAVFSRLAVDAEGRPELWSARWRLASVTNNLSWPGLDLRRVLVEQQ